MKILTKIDFQSLRSDVLQAPNAYSLTWRRGAHSGQCPCSAVRDGAATWQIGSAVFKCTLRRDKRGFKRKPVAFTIEEAAPGGKPRQLGTCQYDLADLMDAASGQHAVQVQRALPVTLGGGAASVLSIGIIMCPMAANGFLGCQAFTAPESAPGTPVQPPKTLEDEDAFLAPLELLSVGTSPVRGLCASPTVDCRVHTGTSPVSSWVLHWQQDAGTSPLPVAAQQDAGGSPMYPWSDVVETVRAEVVEKVEEVTALQLQLRLKEEDAAQASARVEECRQRLQAAQAEASTLQAALTDASDAQTAMQSERDAALEQASAREQQLAQLRAETEAAAANAREQLQAQETVAGRLAVEVAEQGGIVAYMKEEMADLRADLEASRSVQKRTQQTQGVAARTPTRGRQESRNRDQANEVDRQRLNEAQAEVVAKLRERLKRGRADFVAEQQRSTAACQEATELRDKLQRLKADHEVKANEDALRLASWQQELSSLRDRLQLSENDATSLRSRLAEVEAESADHLRRNTDLAAERDSLQKQLKALQEAMPHDERRLSVGTLRQQQAPYIPRLGEQQEGLRRSLTPTLLPTPRPANGRSLTPTLLPTPRPGGPSDMPATVLAADLINFDSCDSSDEDDSDEGMHSEPSSPLGHVPEEQAASADAERCAVPHLQCLPLQIPTLQGDGTIASAVEDNIPTVPSFVADGLVTTTNVTVAEANIPIVPNVVADAAVTTANVPVAPPVEANIPTVPSFVVDDPVTTTNVTVAEAKVTILASVVAGGPVSMTDVMVASAAEANIPTVPNADADGPINPSAEANGLNPPAIKANRSMPALPVHGRVPRDISNIAPSRGSAASFANLQALLKASPSRSRIPSQPPGSMQGTLTLKSHTLGQENPLKSPPSVSRENLQPRPNPLAMGQTPPRRPGRLPSAQTTPVSVSKDLFATPSSCPTLTPVAELPGADAGTPLQPRVCDFDAV